MTKTAAPAPSPGAVTNNPPTTTNTPVAPAPSPTTPPPTAHSPSHTPQQYYSTPPVPPQGSMPMYAPPYQYSTPAYAFTPGFYPPHSPPVYIPPWQQQPFQYYAPPPGVPHIWPPESHNHHNGDAKRTPPQHSVPIPPHILMPQQQHQQHQHPPQHQHQQFYSSPQVHQTAHSHSSYAYAVAGHEHKTHDVSAGVGVNVPITRMQSSPHKRGSARRRSSGGPTSFNGTPNGHGNGSNPNSANSTPSKGRPPSRAPPLKSDLEEVVEAARNLAMSAKTAVSSGDEVTLALQLTSWASSLEEAQKHQNHLQNKNIAIGQNGAAGQTNNNSNQRPSVQEKKFDAIFRASHALEIVSETILFMSIPADSAVHKALVSLYGFVLYGDESMHRSLADEARKLRDALGTTEKSASTDSTLNLLVNSLEKNLVLDPILGSQSLTYKQAAVYKVLRVLQDVADDVAAYNGILPKSPQSTREGNLGSHNHNLSPAGPDPTKVVERSMDAWRRACARLQGEMAIIVVLEIALVSMDEQLAAPAGSPAELVQFFAAVSSIVKARLKMDIEQRNQALRESWWTNVATSDANSVFEAVDARALAWHGLFQTGLSDVEGQLNNIGLGFGPAARVSADKVPALVNCSAGVAALTSTHNHALDWCKETAKVLTGMSVAFAALSQTHGGSYGPPKHLVESFITGMNRASDAIFGVQGWTFDAVYEKIMGSLEKSVDAHATTNNTNVAPKTKGIRFEEPERTEKMVMVRNLSMESQDSEDNNKKQRRKPRHARMKSSPDELLHLGAHLEVPKHEDDADSVESSDSSPQKTPNRNTNGNGNARANTSSSPSSLVTCISEGNELANPTPEIPASMGAEPKKGAGELAVVYEEKLLEYEDDEEEDRHIVVRDDVDSVTAEEQVPGEDGSARKKPSHHSRSMSVDGIPFGV